MGILATAASLFLGQSSQSLVATEQVVRASVSQSYQTKRLRKSGTGTRIAAGVIEDLDPTNEVRGPKWYGENGRIGTAAMMMRDPHVRQSVNYITSPLVSASWRFRPASKDAADREVADFCNFAFLECAPWDQAIKRMVRGYVVNGFDLVEPTYDLKPIPRSRFPSHPGRGSGVVITGLHEIPASTVLRWKSDKTNSAQIDGITQYVQGNDSEQPGHRDIQAVDILRLTWDQDGANYQGMAVLRSAYQPWKLKIALINIDAIKHERLGLGVPTLYMPEDYSKEDIEAAETILAEMRANEKGYIILPNGYRFEWSGTTQNDGTNLNEAIERCNKDIAINVAAGFMLLGLTGQSGSYALGSTQQGQYHLAVENHAKFVAAAFNSGLDGRSIVEKIVRLNYGESVQVPRLEARNLPTRNWSEIAKTVFNGVQVGAITADDALEETLRDSMQLDPHDTSTARKLPSVASAFSLNQKESDQKETQTT